MARGYERATLWVLKTNLRARGFYEKAGWTTDGTTKTEERPGALFHEVRYHANRCAEDTRDKEDARCARVSEKVES